MQNTIEENQQGLKKEVSKTSIIFIIGAILIVLVGIGLYFVTNKKSLPVVQQTSLLAEDQKDVDINNENREISLNEVAEHNTKETCWTVIEGGVYDLTDFISKHKGGDKILSACGIDATDLFTGKSPMGRLHSQMARTLLANMKIGVLR